MGKLFSLGEPSEPHKNANRASHKATRGQEKESLQQSLINFHLYMYFTQTKRRKTFRKSKLIDNGPSSREMYYHQNLRYVGDRWTHFKKEKTGRGRKWLSPSVKDNFRLCVKFESQGDHTGTENLFQPSEQTGLFDVILAKLYAWKCCQ